MPLLSLRLRFAHAAVTGLLLLSCSAWVQANSEANSEVNALLTQGDFSAALARVDKALSANPRDASLRFVRGVVLMDMQRSSEAMAVFEALSQDFPELPDPFNNMALLHVRAQRLDAARLSLETALRNDPQHRTARANLGLVHLMLAAKMWEQLAAQAPLEAPLQNKLNAVRALIAGPAR
jgi:Flp pilus assembly protein TadD